MAIKQKPSRNRVLLRVQFLLTVGLLTLFFIPQNVYAATTLSLLGDRFDVTVDYNNFSNNEFSLLPASAGGQAEAVKLSNEQGYFWFQEPGNDNNVEILVKVLDGCPINNKIWFFAAGTTNLEITITATDTLTSETQSYTNPAGIAFPPIFDTSAFGNYCPMDNLPSLEDSVLQGKTDLDKEIFNLRNENLFPAPIATVGSCVADATTVCLYNDRFQVEIDWLDFRENSGQGQVYPSATAVDSGLFWFFSPNDIVAIVKIIDGRSKNGHFWFFSSALTDVEYTLTVTDTATGQVQTYTKPLVSNQVPISDNRAFAALATAMNFTLIDSERFGEANPKEIIHYRTVLSNPNSVDEQNVIFTDSPDPNTSLVVGSVTTSQGTIVLGNTIGSTTVNVNLGTIPGNGGTAAVEFDVLVNDHFPKTVAQISNKGVIFGENFQNLSTNEVSTPAKSITFPWLVWAMQLSIHGPQSKVGDK